MTCGKPCNCVTYRAHLLSIGISAAAIPSRSAPVAESTQRETQLSKDMDAFKRLHDAGLNPARIDGMARMEARDATRFEIETGRNLPPDMAVKVDRAATEIAAATV